MKRAASTSTKIATLFTRVAMFSFLPFMCIVIITMLLFYRTSSTYVTVSVRNAATALHTTIEKSLEAAIKSYLSSKVETAADLFADTGLTFKDRSPMESEQVRGVISTLATLKVGLSGYYYGIDGTGKMVFHPQNELVGQMLADTEPVRTQLEMKTGYLEYTWQNPNETELHKKALIMTYLPKYDWIIAATSYRSEFLYMIDKSLLSEIVNKTTIAKTGYSYIFARDGEQIAHPYLSKSDLKGIVSEEEYMDLIHKMFEIKNGPFRYLWRDSSEGRKYEKVVYLKYLPEFDWIIGTAIYKKEILFPVYITLGTYIVAALLTTLSVLFYILRINGKIGGSIGDINTVLQAARNGDLSIRVMPSNVTEVGEIGRNLNYLLESLEKTTRELEDMNVSLEEKILTRTAELRKATEKFIESEKRSTTSKIVAGIAHEINTPIGVAITAASFQSSIIEKIRDNHDEKECEKYLTQWNESSTIILRNLEKAAELISRLKNISMDLEQHEKRTIQIKHLVEHTIHDLRPVIDTKHIEIRTDLPSDVCIFSYPDLLRIIFINLFHNSLYHGYENAEGGTIDLRIEIQDETAVITYADNGQGIPEKDRERIFDLFYTTSRRTGKSGIGLSVVHNIVSNFLNGTISVDSRVGEFAKFTITFPAKPVPCPAE